MIRGAGVTFGASGTVIRIRGRFSAFLNSYTSAGDGYQGAFGIGVATSAAFNAGVASLPTPITEQAWDGWMYYTIFGVHGSLAAGSSSVGVHSNTAFDIEVDTKAMRKVSDEITVFPMLEVVEIGTAVMSVFFDSRLLLKLG